MVFLSLYSKFVSYCGAAFVLLENKKIKAQKRNKDFDGQKEDCDIILNTTIKYS